MRIFFSVGEPSGDLHGANLIKDLRKLDPTIETFGFGGPKMADAGCHLLFDLTALAVMGLWNVLVHVRKFFALLAEADRFIAQNQIDAVVLIDYPGFNWWIARKARKHNVEVFYYGVPQMWAWLPWRVRKLRRLVDHVLCKLPFEVPWFERHGCQATYVGHPYFDELVRYQYDRLLIDSLDSKPGKLLVLLPGSRTQEVHRNLPGLVESAACVRDEHPETRVAIACFRGAHAEFAKEFLRESGMDAQVFTGKTPELISVSDACIACSGSVSLELLFHRKPTVIVYRVSPLVMLLQTVMLKTRFITLVNMLGCERIEKSEMPPYHPEDPESDVAMPEFLGWRNRSKEVSEWVNRWFGDPLIYDRKQQQLDELANRFAHAGASGRAASFIVTTINRRAVVIEESSSSMNRNAA